VRGIFLSLANIADFTQDDVLYQWGLDYGTVYEFDVLTSRTVGLIIQVGWLGPIFCVQ
jgi:hypothetical protein